MSNILQSLSKTIHASLAIAIIFLTLISYFSVPAFYDKDQIKAKIENQILDQYNLKVKFSQTLKYGLLPKPHFYSKNTIINYKSSNLAKSKNTKIFISIKNFFSLEDLLIKNTIRMKALIMVFNIFLQKVLNLKDL